MKQQKVLKMEKENKNEFHAYWQCPNCNIVNIDIADNILLDIKSFECKNCGKKYTLRKKITQILCQPLMLSL